MRSVAALRRFARERPVSRDRCDACKAPLASPHEHRVDPKERRLQCVCAGCVTVGGESGEIAWKRVPRRVVSLRDFPMTESEWERLALPIRLVFFVVSSVEGRTLALFPSPGGPTESPLEPGAWERLASRDPLLATMEPDVEALLVNHAGAARDHYLAPIDACYGLVGTLRRSWRGFGGGPVVWDEIANRMAELRRESAGA